jgi:outer membrane protein
MNDSARLPVLLVTALSLVGARFAWGADALDAPPPARNIDEAWVVSTLKNNNPSLRVAAIELEQTRAATQLEEGKFPYTFQADGNYTRLRTPQLNSDSTLASQGDALVLGSQLSRTFATGTKATLRLEGQYSNGQNSMCESLGTTTTPDCYQTSLRATLTQPLLSGYGSKVNLASLRAARISEQKQRKTFDRQTSELLRDALLGFWEFYYNSKAVEIQLAALELTKAQQREADQRVDHGQLAAADALKFRTQVATLTESLINAQAALATSASELGRLVGITTGGGAWKASGDAPEVAPSPAMNVVIEKLRAQSPALAEQVEALRLARERRETAGDEYRARLDASTWIEAGGVGSGQLAPAFRQTGTLGAVSVYAGLTFQKTLDEKRLRAARSQAAQAEALADANLAVTAQQLETTAVQTWQKAEQARAILQAASDTLAVASQQADNERQRFSLGANTYLDVQVAEDTLRQARLRVVRASVDQIKARIALDHTTGDLLSERL